MFDEFKYTTERNDKYARQMGEYDSIEIDNKEIPDIMLDVFGEGIEYNPQAMGANRMSPLSVYITNEYCNQFGITLKDLYSINSHGLRCDELTKQHDGKHILFAGCSVTFGEGVPLEHTWAHKTYTKISEKEKTSGYYNIAQSGSSSNWIIIQVLKYIRDYGVPDVLFINFPDATRELGYVENKELIQSLTVNLYAVMVSQIQAAGGKVYSFSWDARVNDGYKGEDQALDVDARLRMTDFFRYNEVTEKHQHVFKFVSAYKDTGTFVDRFLMFAMDDGHPGLAEHDFYAHFAYEVYSGKRGG
tara:strand:- start:355 stop:1260 length:906 start_codon:yes stop_codon:yes gene_type:complete